MKKVIWYILILICLVETGYIIFFTKNSYDNFSDSIAYSVLWTQCSAEYEALCYQAFNGAKQYISKIKNKAKKQAIILDIDETVLNNVIYEASLINSEYNENIFIKWCKEIQAESICGAVDFCNFVKDSNIEIFYISNRSKIVLEETIENLKKLNFPYADKKHVLLKENASDKQDRFNYVKTLGFDIVLYGNDKLDIFDKNFTNKNYIERKQWVKENKDKFGNLYIILPNIIYSDLYETLDKNYRKYSKSQWNKIKYSFIKYWRK